MPPTLPSPPGLRGSSARAATARWVGSPSVATSASPPRRSWSPPSSPPAVCACRWCLWCLPSAARAVPARPARTGGEGTRRLPHRSCDGHRRQGLVREAVAGRGVPVHRLRRPEHIHLALRPAAPGRRYGSGHCGLVRALSRRRGGLRAGRQPGQPLGPGRCRPPGVPRHGRRRRGDRVHTRPGDLRVRGADLLRPVRSLLTAGHPRPGLPAHTRRHRRMGSPSG